MAGRRSGYEKSILLNYLGDSVLLRILDFLLENQIFDYSKSQIIGGSCVAKASFYKYWGKLEEIGAVRVTRRFGKTKLYTLNTKSPFVQRLIDLDLDLIEETSPKKVAVRARNERIKSHVGE